MLKVKSNHTFVNGATEIKLSKGEEFSYDTTTMMFNSSEGKSLSPSDAMTLKRLNVLEGKLDMPDTTTSNDTSSRKDDD